MFTPGENLKTIRRNKGKSLAQLSALTGITVDKLKALEEDEIPFTLNIIKKISPALDTEVEFWLELKEKYTQKLVRVLGL